MKRILALLLAALLLFSLPACGKKADPPAFTDPQQITIEYLKDRTIPYSLLGLVGGFETEFRNDDELNAGLYASSSTQHFRFDGKNIQVNECVDYDNGEFTHCYYDTDMEDPYMYIEENDDAHIEELIERSLQQRLNSSFLYIDTYSCSITDYGTNDGKFEVGYDAKDSNNDDQLVMHVTLTIDPQSGLILSGEIETYTSDVVAGIAHLTIRYSSATSIDTSIKDRVNDAQAAKARGPVTQEPEEETPAEAPAAALPDELTFAAEGLDGELYTYSDFASGKLLMVNFWEPWCAPCVSEMPDLEELYEKYHDQGFDILGVITDTDSAETVISDAGITYPCVLADNRLSVFATDAVPTTYFVGQGGKVLTAEPYVGARTYEEWDAIIQELLESQS